MTFQALMIALTVGILPAQPSTGPRAEGPTARVSAGQPLATSDLNRRLLDLHNQVRADVGVAPLSWSRTLAQQARAWGEALLALGQLEHDRQRGAVGENLWAGWGRRFAPEEMIAAWTSEREAYVPGPYPDVRRFGDTRVVGHYTQMVWRDTTEVGCALSERDDRQVLVCRYSPPGNVRGRLAY